MTDKADNDALVTRLERLLPQMADPDWLRGEELPATASLVSMLPAILAALRTPQPEVGETGWLIELPLTASAGGRLCWVALEDGPFPLFRTLNHGEDYDFQKIASPLRFTPESDEALRFARKVDAENFMAKFDRYLLHAVVTEHAWPEATRPQPDETETLRAEVARLNGKLLDIKRRCLRHPDDTPEDDTRDKRIAYTIASEALKGTDHGRG